MIYKCLNCQEEIKDYNPEMCCSGHECGCMGLPIHPPLCSAACAEGYFKDLLLPEEGQGALAD